MENTTVKTPPEDPETENLLNRKLENSTKPSPYRNGVLKLLHAPHAPRHAPHAPQVPSQYKEFPISHAPPLGPHAPHAALQLTEYKKTHALNDSVTYKECLKNHAAAMGGHAVDGCGEYMPSQNSLMCAACSCHRNFHRRNSLSPPPLAHSEKNFMPLHRHHPPPPSPSASPPISSSYAPHMLALSSQNPNHDHSPSNPNGGSMSNSGRKRFRTKFTHDQKEKMYEFAGKLSWKMQRRDEDVINEFCNGIGVDKGVFKVWMHNNKNTLGKKESGEGNGVEKNGDYHGLNNGSRVDEVSAHPTNELSSSC